MFWPQRKPEYQLPKIKFDGNRIFLRPPEAEDVHDWIELRSKNQDFLKPYEPEWPKNSLTTNFYDRRLNKQIENWRMDKSQPFLIFKKDGTFIGGMNINNICRGSAQYASLGYWLDEDHQGQGYMIEALHLTLKYAFKKLDLHRVHAACLPNNERSKKLLLNTGFIEEGFAKKFLQIDSKWQDHALFGITREDWVIPKSA